ncbi:AMP-binding protein [Pseudohalioglobus lutimaris]|uniref:ATP-dependent acyl-CoA ligase n=1 Tax=Pseudohalioglobus lutimaris TaxID=1737061 RepID=A0A2N5X2J4_9GAMM|nr:AMP-binding protein [Pseudohalioglobus lutimaris]PLW68717.1 ATP-dependent acyl-CoA ligase [Pseudohalioglobus lutimaris]
MEVTANLGILAQLIAQRSAELPDVDITTFVDERSGVVETRSYRQLKENSHRLAAYMIEKGMQKGDRFAAILCNHPEMVEALIAASVAGCVLVPIDPRTKGDKLVFILKDSGCKGLICADYNAEAVDQVLERTAVSWVLHKGDATFSDGVSAERYDLAIAGQPSDIEIRATSEQDPIQILYTSGTTGDPKGILKSNQEFVQVGQVFPMISPIAEDDIFYTGLSLTHGNAQGLTLAISLFTGRPGVYSVRFTKSRLWETIRKYGCTRFNLLGGMTAAIYSEPVKADDADNPVRQVLSAGMPAAIWSDFEKRFDLTLFEAFGAAEGGLFWNDGSGPVGSLGNMLNNPLYEARLVDDEDQDVGIGERGELIWRNRNENPVSVTYVNKPEASAEKVRDGWFRTGDIMHADENGWMFFDSRKGGGIRRNGDFINTGFVEKVLAEHSQVDDVFVYGVPAANGTPGEKDVVAAIVPHDRDAFDPTDVFAKCRAELEANFVPTYLHLVSAIPKTASEKPQERFLLEMFSKDSEDVITE